VRIKLTAIALAVSLFAIGVGDASVGRAHPEVTLHGALSSERISGYGTVTPARDGGRARLTLKREAETGWVKVASQWIRLRGASDSDGDGRRDSRYSGSFASPADGNCRLKLRVPETELSGAARVIFEMPCARPDFPTGTATLIPTSAPTSQTEISVEIADTGERQQFGLMFKRRLAADRGMAFQFAQPQQGSNGFWMKNTLIPLSIAFYATDGTIVRIMDMQPCESDPCPIYSPEAEYQGALEVNLGAFDEWGISEGDIVIVN
jgi:uncharacterized membrane protein (UPF0127 family)